MRIDVSHRHKSDGSPGEAATKLLEPRPAVKGEPIADSSGALGIGVALLFKEALRFHILDDIDKPAGFTAGGIIGSAEKAGEMLGIASHPGAGRHLGPAEILDKGVGLLLWAW